MKAPKMYYGVSWNGGLEDTFEDDGILVSAGVAWYTDKNSDWFGSFRIPDKRDGLWVDSGGFQATRKWGTEYPFTVGECFNWAEQVVADYVATPDIACEPSLDSSTVDERVVKTVSNTVEATNLYQDGQWSFELVPVLQGFTVEDYRKCATMFEMYGLDTEYQAIGTVCKREDTDEIHRVLSLLEDRFPDAEWHMFGLTKRAWKDRRFWGRFRSADTAAWNWGCSDTAEKMEKATGYIADIDAIRDDIRKQQRLEQFEVNA